MSTFQLDTSGAVIVLRGLDAWPDRITWADLSPFAQGYVAAAFASLPRFGGAELPMLERPDAGGFFPVTFSDLAPETLAAMLKDCEAYSQATGAVGLLNNPDQGAHFWRARQEGRAAHSVYGLPYAPVTLYLGKDGRVHQQEPGQ